MWDALEWERRCGNPAAQERGSKGNINFENEACRICLYLREKIWWGFPKFSLLCRNLISGRRGAVGGKIESGLRKGWFYWEKEKNFFSYKFEQIWFWLILIFPFRPLGIDLIPQSKLTWWKQGIIKYSKIKYIILLFIFTRTFLWIPNLVILLLLYLFEFFHKGLLLCALFPKRCKNIEWM